MESSCAGVGSALQVLQQMQVQTRVSLRCVSNKLGIKSMGQPSLGQISLGPSHLGQLTGARVILTEPPPPPSGHPRWGHPDRSHPRWALLCHIFLHDLVAQVCVESCLLLPWLLTVCQVLLLIQPPLGASVKPTEKLNTLDPCALLPSTLSAYVFGPMSIAAAWLSISINMFAHACTSRCTFSHLSNCSLKLLA